MGHRNFLPHNVLLVFVKLSSSEVLKRNEKSRALMAEMLFESLFLWHSSQKDITKIVTSLSLYFFITR